MATTYLIRMLKTNLNDNIRNPPPGEFTRVGLIKLSDLAVANEYHNSRKFFLRNFDHNYQVFWETSNYIG